MAAKRNGTRSKVDEIVASLSEDYRAFYASIGIEAPLKMIELLIFRDIAGTLAEYAEFRVRRHLGLPVPGEMVGDPADDEGPEG